MTKVNICADYRERFGWDMPTLKLARIVYQDNPLLFSNVESARLTLRNIEGKSNNRVRVRKEVPERPKNPYNLPQSDEAIYQPYELKAKRLLVLSDIHIPYHSIDALTCVFDYAKNEKPDAILLNGDTLDFLVYRDSLKTQRRGHLHMS